MPDSKRSFVCAILGAGAGRRIGRGSKAFVTLADGRTFAAAIAATARDAGVERTVLVVRPEDRGRPLPADVARLVNPEPERGMLSSIQVAVGAALLDDAVDALLIWPADCPRVPAGTVRRLLLERRRHRAPLAVPSHRKRRGHPALFGRPLFTDLLEAPAGEGARAVVRAWADRIHYVDAGPEVLDDLDTLADLSLL